MRTLSSTSRAAWRRDQQHAVFRIGLVLAGLIAAVALVVGLPLGAAPASAHAQLLESHPAVDEALEEAPTEITLRFNEQLLDIGPLASVVDADGTEWTDGPLTIDGDTATAPLRDGMPPATYELRWQVVSADGHPVSGVIPFSVEGGQGAVAPVETAAPAGAQPDPNDAAGADAEGNAATGGDAAEANADEGMPEPLRITLIAVLGAAIAVGVLWFVRSLRRNRASSAEAETDASRTSR